MMKHSVIKALLLTSLVSITAQSANANMPSMPWKGFYIGAAVGGNAMTGTSNLDTTRVVGGAPFAQNGRFSISDKNVAGDIFVGFGRRINCAWLAIEAIAGLSSLTSRSTFDFTDANSQQLNIKTTNSWGGAFNIGYFVHEMTKLYIKLGIESRRFRHTFINSDGNVPTLLGVNKSLRSTAFVPGFGMETELNCRFALRTEYRTALHPRKTTTVSGTTPSVSSVKAKPTIHYFTVGLTFRI
jgi:opacity protein-like surface antigen